MPCRSSVRRARPRVPPVVYPQAEIVLLGREWHLPGRLTVFAGSTGSPSAPPGIAARGVGAGRQCQRHARGRRAYPVSSCTVYTSSKPSTV